MDWTLKLKGSTAKKIRPATLFILIMLTAAAGYTVLGMALVKQEREQKSLALQIDQLRLPATVGREKLEALERKAEAIRKQLASEQASFPSRLSNTEIVDWIQQVAEQSQIKVFVLQARPPSIQKIDSGAYNVLRFDITAQGEFTQLKNFIRRLEDETFRTLVLDRVDINLDPAKSSVNLGLSVYAHPVVVGSGSSEAR